MAGASGQTSRGNRPNKAARWPVRALQVLEDVQSLLRDIGRNSDSIDKQSAAINNNAGLALDALRRANEDLVADILLDIQQRTATQRHTNAGIKGAAESAWNRLAAARVGEYGGEG